MIANEFLSNRGEKLLAQAKGLAEKEPRRALQLAYQAGDVYAEATSRENSPILRDKFFKKFRESERMSIELVCNLLVDDKEQHARKVDSPVPKMRRNIFNNDEEYDPSWVEKECVIRTDVNFDDVVGLGEVKKKLKLNMIKPMKEGKVFPGLGKSRGLIMYGPPGCGKTYVASAASNEIGKDATFLSVDMPSLLSKWYGESSKHVKDVFNYSKEHSPSIIFFDELDALTSEHGVTENEATRRVNSTILTEIDGVKKQNKGDIFVLGGTNRPWDLTSPIKSRLRPLVYVPAPDKKSKEEIMKKQVHKMFEGDNLLPDVSVDADFGYIAGVMHNDRRGVYSGRDIETIVANAFEKAAQDYYSNGGGKKITSKYFIDSIKEIGPGISFQELKRYEDYGRVSYERQAVRQ